MCMKRYVVVSHVYPLLTVACIGLSWIGWWLHFSNMWVGNSMSWVCWLLALFFLSMSVFNTSKRIHLRFPTKETVLLTVAVTGIYICAHAFVFSHAPWNLYGLFDDAAWDIYFANIHTFHAPFQAAYFDTVGYISREVVFHYYITVLFRLFGYNLLVFNLGLLFLGYITLLGVVHIIQQLFHKNVLSLFTGVLLTFWPLFYMHIYMGHRYAIAVPLMVCSLYFLYTGFQKKSDFRIIVSSLFAALCLGSSVMGKQFLYALICACVCLLMSTYGRSILWKYKKHISYWIIGFIIAATPLLAYIIADPALYSIRETGLVREFISSYSNHGFAGIASYAQGMGELFFAPFSGRRQFLNGFPVIPLPYIVLILPGLILMWKRRRFELVAISLIPIAASFISGAYDFRVLFALPGWVFAMVYTIHSVLYESTHSRAIRLVGMSLMCIAIFVGYGQSVLYIYDVAQNPKGQYLLPHADVAVARLIQDIAAGESHPTILLKWNEFNRYADRDRPYDIFVAPASSYAVMHLYLQPFDDKAILSFSDGGIQRLMSADELFSFNRKAILEYKPHGKDLTLIWERTEKSKYIYALFKDTSPYATDTIISENIEGTPIFLDILTIPSEYIEVFQQSVKQLSYNAHI